MVGSKPRLKVLIYIIFLEKLAQLIGYYFFKYFRQEGAMCGRSTPSAGNADETSRPCLLPRTRALPALTLSA